MNCSREEGEMDDDRIGLKYFGIQGWEGRMVSQDRSESLDTRESLERKFGARFACHSLIQAAGSEVERTGFA